MACHTASGGAPFAGGLKLSSPIGIIYSTNITPDLKTGIGEYSLQDFDRAVRQGISRDGHTLYPAMPYPSYATVRSGDIEALYAYFMQGVRPVVKENHATDIPWPLSMRWPLALWRKLFAPIPVMQTTPVDEGDKLAWGRYLVTGLGHCGACHTPRGWAFQEKALSEDQGSLYLSGGVVDHWLARNLRGNPLDGLGQSSANDIAQVLATGRTQHSAAFGSMVDVVEKSTQHLKPSDLQAIGLYLKTLPAASAASVVLPKYDVSAARALASGSDKSLGAITYINNCNACHRSSGFGYAQTFPALAQNGSLNASDPTSVIRIILSGSQMAWTKTAPTHYAMPGFAERLSNHEVAAVASFVRSSWGNHAGAVTDAQVARVRAEIGASKALAR